MNIFFSFYLEKREDSCIMGESGDFAVYFSYEKNSLSLGLTHDASVSRNFCIEVCMTNMRINMIGKNEYER